MASLRKWFKDRASDIGDVAGATYHGLNPLDNGQGWTNTPVQRPGGNRSVIDQIPGARASYDFAKPVYRAGDSLVKGTGNLFYHTAAIPIEGVRAGIGAITHNRDAAVAANRRAGENFQPAVDFARYPLQAATRVGLDLKQLNTLYNNPNANGEAAGVYQPTGALKLLLGGQPIESHTNQFVHARDSGQSLPEAVGNLTVSAIGDAAALKGGYESIKKVPAVAERTPQTVYRTGVPGEKPTFVATSKEMAQKYGDRPGSITEKYSIKPKDVFDPTNKKHYAILEKAVGPDMARKLTSETRSRRFDPAREDLVNQIAQNNGFKAAAFDEAGKVMPKNTKLPKDTRSISIVDQSALRRPRAGLGMSTADVSGELPTRSTNKIPTTMQSKPTGPSARNDRTESSSSSRAPLNVKKYVAEQTRKQANAGKSSGVLDRFRKEFATKGIDALSAIEKPVEKAVGGREKNVTLRNALDRSLRSDSIAGQYLKDSQLPDVIKTTKTAEFNQYLTARHAADLERNGVKTGRNSAADAELVRQLGPKYEAQAKVVGEYNNALLDKTVEYGLISKETAAYLKEKYPNYVPFDRIFNDAELKNMRGNGSGPASLSTQTVIQRIKGSEREIQPPLESILAKTHDVFAQGERNIAAKTIAETAKLPDNPLKLKELKPGEAAGNRPTISYIENGQKHTFLTTPEVAQAAKSLNRQQLGLIGRILAIPARTLRLGATGVNVGFTLANVTKDVASGIINSRHPIESLANPKTFLDALQAATNHGGKKYSELVREGAGGTSFDITRNAARDTVAKIRSERNVATKIAYDIRHPGELVRAVEDTIGRSEEFGRAAQYYGNKRAAIKEGKSLSQAKAYGADAARNNTVNFARAGEYGRVLNSVLPYVNAGIQGSRTLLRNLRDRPAQTGAKIAITAFFPVAATTAWNLNDPERKAAYDDIEEWEKEGNIIIIPPHPHKDPKTGRWNVIKIPVSQEVANLNNVVRNGVEAMHNDKDFDFAGLAGNLTGTATSLNAQSGRQVANQVIPQGLKAPIEALTNQNLFTGNPIVPDSKKSLDAADQYGNNTTGTAKTIGRKTGISPYQIDNFIKTSFGGAGQNAVNATDQALAKLGVIPQSDVKGKTIPNSIASRFTSAQGQSEYAPIDKAIKDKTAELKRLPGYQKLSPEEKAKALNRLENDVVTSTKNAIDAKNGTGQFDPEYTGKQKALSKRQAGLITGKTDVSSYLTTQSSKSGGSGSSDDYKLNQARLTNKKNNGDLNGWLDTAQKQLNVLVKEYNNPDNTELDKLTIQNQADSLRKQIAKYKSYGGFTKPKKGRKGKGTQAVTASFKTATKSGGVRRPAGVKVRKLSSAKKLSTRKQSVSKISSNYSSKRLA